MTGNSNLNDAFKRVEGEFSRLRRLYVDRKLTPSEFIAELKKLRVKDEAGRYWTIGAQSGQWYYFDGQNWLRADPPWSEGGWWEEKPTLSSLEKDSMEIEKTLTPGAGSRLPEARLIQPALNVPSVPSESINAGFETSEMSWVLSSLPLFPTSLFLGSLGSLLGVILGAIIGSTSFFLGQLKFLPLFLQEIQGKLTGGLIFAGLGSVLGFISGFFLGWIIALLFNFTCSLSGGLGINVRPKKKAK